MLVKLQVRVTRKDPKDPAKEVSQFEDYAVNTDTIQAVLPVPETETCVLKLLGGDQVLTKGSLDEIVKATKE